MATRGLASDKKGASSEKLASCFSTKVVSCFSQCDAERGLPVAKLPSNMLGIATTVYQ